MKILSALVSAAILAFYLYLVSRSPLFTLVSPRGGIVSLGLSLLIANTMIWLSRHTDGSASTRFQLIVAGWIWIVVQFGCFVYSIHAMA